MPVRFAELDTGQDPQLGELAAAALQALQVALDVEGLAEERAAGRDAATDARRYLGAVKLPRGEVRVLGERHGRQPDLHGAGAAGPHVPARRVPGPLAVHVAIGRQHTDAIPSGRRPDARGDQRRMRSARPKRLSWRTKARTPRFEPGAAR